MKQDYTDITVILDRSGSMASVKDDTIGGFNSFLSEQKKVKGKCTISLYQFDDKCETVYENLDIQAAPNLALEPRNNTALLDAIGESINRTGNRLKSMLESARPSKVIVLIQTDGQENASKKFTKDKIFEMISHQREKYNWEFVFLGANQDAIATAASYGIARGSSLTYASNSMGTQEIYKSLNKNFTNFRCSVTNDASFDNEDRANQAKAGIV